MFQSANGYNANGKKPEGQPTRCAHGHGRDLARGCTPWNPHKHRLSQPAKHKGKYMKEQKTTRIANILETVPTLVRVVLHGLAGTKR